jgi:hypothetical protein
MNEVKGTALIIHGYNLHQSDWYEVMWGDPVRGLLGRAPMGVLLAYYHEPGLIVWNTGASEKDGVREGKYILHYTLSHLHELPNQFPAFFDSVDIEQLRSNIVGLSVTETESMSTSEALANALSLVLTPEGEPLCSQIMQVSSLNHASRIQRDAERLWWEEKGMHGILIGSYGAHTGYGGGTASEVQIQELVPEKRPQYDAERIAGRRQ